MLEWQSMVDIYSPPLSPGGGIHSTVFLNLALIAFGYAYCTFKLCSHLSSVRIL